MSALQLFHLVTTTKVPEIHCNLQWENKQWVWTRLTSTWEWIHFAIFFTILKLPWLQVNPSNTSLLRTFQLVQMLLLLLPVSLVTTKKILSLSTRVPSIEVSLDLFYTEHTKLLRKRKLWAQILLWNIFAIPMKRKQSFLQVIHSWSLISMESFLLVLKSLVKMFLLARSSKFPTQMPKLTNNSKTHHLAVVVLKSVMSTKSCSLKIRMACTLLRSS